MNEWKSSPLSEVTTKIGSGATPRGGSSIYIDEGIPFIRSQNVDDGVFDESGLVFIDFESARALDNVTTQEEDILLNITGESVARTCKVPKRLVGGRVNQHVAIIRSNDHVNSQFLLYALIQNKPVLDQMSEIGGTRRALTKGMLEGFEIMFPPHEEQKAIAEVLSSLDDKIDLLKRQNKTLEGMAEALFRQWFIEEAQDDWGEFSASDFVEHIKESEKPQSKPDTWFSHFSLPAFDDGKKPLKEKGEDIKSNKYVVQANSLLVSKLNPGTPRIWHCGSTLPQNPICSTEFQVVKPQPHLLGFFRCLYSSKEVVEFLSACASGTSGSHQRVKPKDIVELEFQAPSEDSMMEFSSLTADWFEKILENQAQIFTLENERNTLLPKLMSGEVRVQLD